MDNFLRLQFLIIAILIGFCIALCLTIKSYIKIALIVLCIYIPIELYYNYKQNFMLQDNKSHSPILSPIVMNSPMTSPMSRNTNNDLPLDGLDPETLTSRLNYIYYATANPTKLTNYKDFVTHADKYLNDDGNKLMNSCRCGSSGCRCGSGSGSGCRCNSSSGGSGGSGDGCRCGSSGEGSNLTYPQLTKNQIDARDCLNMGSSKESCFQSAQLFYNVRNDFNILTKGVNFDNANLIIHED